MGKDNREKLYYMAVQEIFYNDEEIKRCPDSRVNHFQNYCLAGVYE